MEHLSQRELKERIEKAEADVVVSGRYTHYKDHSKTYIVKDIVIVEATNEPAVIYQAEYGEGITFSRPLSEWLEEVEWKGEMVPRFIKVNI